MVSQIETLSQKGVIRKKVASDMIVFRINQDVIQAS